MALARAVAVVIVTQGVRAEQRASETGFAKNRDPVPVENFIAPTLWRVEALLDLMDGAAAPPPRINPRVDVARVLTHLGFKGSDDVADDAAGCVAAAKMSVDGSDDEAVMFTWTSHMGLWCHGTTAVWRELLRRGHGAALGRRRYARAQESGGCRAAVRGEPQSARA